jgi:hypothetical protein
MQILLIIPFIFYINILSLSYSPTQCILPPTPYGPAYIQANNTTLDEWRASLNEVTSNKQYRTLLNANENIKCLEIMPIHISQYRRCFQYAIETITGFNGFIELPENQFSINLEKYFQQTPYPKKNDLIIYTSNEKNRAIHHFAVAIDQIWFQSKSGNLSQSSKHLPFDLIGHYGKAAWSFGLKKKYQGIEGTKRLLQNMQLDLYKALKTTTKCIELQNETIDNLRNQNKQHKFQFFCFGAIMGISYMICLPLLIQRYKKSLS